MASVFRSHDQIEVYTHLSGGIMKTVVDFPNLWENGLISGIDSEKHTIWIKSWTYYVVTKE
jgi:hypothetical protein